MHCYLDAGGTKDPYALSCAGWIASEESWVNFDHEWSEALRNEGVSEFHMSQLAHFQGEFKGWKGDEGRRIKFLQKLVAIIKANTVRHIGITLHMDMYNRLDAETTIRARLGPPYVLTMLFTAIHLQNWQERHAPSDALSVFFEHGDDDQGLLLRALKNLQYPFPLQLVRKRQQTVNGVRYVTPFQAADFLAYELHKGTKEMRRAGKNEIKGRKSLVALLPVGPDDYTGVIDIHALGAICKSFGVMRRQKRDL